jgi:hypothetical protein
MTPWEIHGRELANCNCNFGCPCQFSVLPSRGNCEAVAVFDIETGHYGDIRLDGLRSAVILYWPGAIHEGNGQMQVVIDPAASNEQRDALEKIMTGADTEEMATMWFVFSAMSPNKHKTVIAPISIEMNIEDRTARASAEGVFDLALKPIPNIVTGDPSRARIDLPNGFEFTVAELASGRSRLTGGAMAFAPLEDTHAHLAELHLSGQGILRPAA